MIRKQDILDRAAEWRLRADVVEKDYVLGWLLAALAAHPEVRASWLFKGGTCLKKCYFETYRFSEDLDFSLSPGATYSSAGLVTLLREVVRAAQELSGIEFPADRVSVKERRNKQGLPTFQGKVAYRGPLAPPSIPTVLFDLTVHEPVLDGTALRGVFHAFPDELPDGLVVPAYTIEELLAEKTRALVERCRPRDLYDQLQIVENHADGVDFDRARDLFAGKCRHKSFEPPGAAAVRTLVADSGELVADWEQLLSHQLPVLPPLAGVLGRLEPVLAWLDPEAAAAAPAPVPRVPVRSGEELVAPAAVTYWGGGPLETIRFAAANRLLVEFDYHGSRRLVEPYSLRRPATGNLLLYAWERGSSQIKAYKVAELGALEVSAEPFVPRYAVELTGTLAPGRSRGSPRRG